MNLTSVLVSTCTVAGVLLTGGGLWLGFVSQRHTWLRQEEETKAERQRAHDEQCAAKYREGCEDSRRELQPQIDLLRSQMKACERERDLHMQQSENRMQQIEALQAEMRRRYWSRRENGEG